jgi:hypothetical protein
MLLALVNVRPNDRTVLVHPNDGMSNSNPVRVIAEGKIELGRCAKKNEEKT